MKISIVLSIYNGEKYILEQVDSLKKQIRPADEVLIFDDCSTDKTIDIVKKYIEKNKLENWKLINNVYNKGWRKNFIDGMRQAKGDIIFTCDQDDIWDIEKINTMENIMKQNENINVLASNFYLYKNQNLKLGHERNFSGLKKIGYINRIFNISYPGCTYCIRKKYVDKIIKYWKDEYPHDAFFWMFSLFDETTYVIDEPLIKWRKHFDSAFSIETEKSKNYIEKLKWLDYGECIVGDLYNYVSKNIKKDKDKKLKVLEKYKNWIEIRRKFYIRQNLIYGINLIFYLGCYSRLKQYIGDWVITYLWKPKGNKNIR